MIYTLFKNKLTTKILIKIIQNIKAKSIKNNIIENFNFINVKIKIKRIHFRSKKIYIFTKNIKFEKIT